MPLPWLIGAAVVGIGAAIVNKLSDKDDDYDYDYAAESRRRDELERERVKKEREQKIQAARENFALRGERIGSDIEKSLQGWVKVDYRKKPAFSAELNSSSHAIKNHSAEASSVQALVPVAGKLFDEARENLKVYSEVYAVSLKQGPELIDALNQIKSIDAELQQIAQLKAEIARIKDGTAAYA